MQMLNSTRTSRYEKDTRIQFHVIEDGKKEGGEWKMIRICINKSDKVEFGKRFRQQVKKKKEKKTVEEDENERKR